MAEQYGLIVIIHVILLFWSVHTTVTCSEARHIYIHTYISVDVQYNNAMALRTIDSPFTGHGTMVPFLRSNVVEIQVTQRWDCL